MASKARARTIKSRTHAKKSKDGRSRSHIRETMFLGFGCFRFANIKERVNVQIEKIVQFLNL